MAMEAYALIVAKFIDMLPYATPVCFENIDVPCESDSEAAQNVSRDYCRAVQK